MDKHIHLWIVGMILMGAGRDTFWQIMGIILAFIGLIGGYLNKTP